MDRMAISDEQFDELMRDDRIFGDDLSDEDIARWFQDEKNASFACYEGVDASQYDALNRIHAFDRLKGRRFGKCLALGVADGRDLEPIAGQVTEFLCIEPEERWWRRDIAGVPSAYRLPRMDGAMTDVPTGSVDLAIALGCLHHIPNVSFVISEMGRILAPGGVLVLREPIVMMGDWRRPRPRMTARERGIPLAPLVQALRKSGVSLKSLRYIDCPLVARGAARFGIKPYDNPFMVRADWVISFLLRWNMHYRPRNLFEKIAPSSVVIMGEKQ